MEISQKEPVSKGLNVTSKEIDKRLHFPYEKLCTAFEDLACNRIMFHLPGGRYDQRSGFLKNFENELCFEQVFYWHDLSEGMRSYEIQKYEESGDFGKVSDEIKRELGNETETKLFHQIGDYSLEEEESLVVSFGKGKERVTLEVDYPLYSDAVGTINISSKPANKNLELDMKKVSVALHILSNHALIPKITGLPDDIVCYFSGVLDERELVSRYEEMKRNLGRYKSLFGKDLENLKNIKAEHGLHRAIVYFLGTEVGLMLLQNTDLWPNRAIISHEAILESWLEDPHRKDLIENTGFSTDNMRKYMHTFIGFKDGKAIWTIDRGNVAPDWARSPNLDEVYITAYLSKEYGISSETEEIPREVSEQLARSGMLKPEIDSNFEFLKAEYGSSFAKRYEQLAEKFLIKGGGEFDPGWDEFQAIQRLLSYRSLDTASK